ncbi:MAG: hypothetical protein AAGA59_08275 [Actinomycetota bacterium]
MTDLTMVLAGVRHLEMHWGHERAVHEAMQRVQNDLFIQQAERDRRLREDAARAAAMRVGAHQAVIRPQSAEHSTTAKPQDLAARLAETREELSETKAKLEQERELVDSLRATNAQLRATMSVPNEPLGCFGFFMLLAVGAFLGVLLTIYVLLETTPLELTWWF